MCSGFVKLGHMCVCVCVPSSTDVILEKFYFVDIQSLCEIRDNDEARFLPCELAIVEYSIAAGISANYHCFVDPGKGFCASLICNQLTALLGAQAPSPPGTATWLSSRVRNHTRSPWTGLSWQNVTTKRSCTT